MHRTELTKELTTMITTLAQIYKHKHSFIYKPGSQNRTAAKTFKLEFKSTTLTAERNITIQQKAPLTTTTAKHAQKLHKRGNTEPTDVPPLQTATTRLN